MKISHRYRRVADLYLRFSKDWSHMTDASEDALVAQYRHESVGAPKPPDTNAYTLGKKWMDATIAMWKEDLDKGLLLRDELESDYPDWFLDKVLRSQN